MPRDRGHRTERPLALIAGGGVAALEAALALRHLAAERVEVEVVAPEVEFAYRPLAVGEPFGLSEVHRLDLGRLLRHRDVRHRRDRLAGVDPDRRVARLGSGFERAYDWLLVAVGARPLRGVPGTLIFGGPDSVGDYRALLAQLERGGPRHVVFAAPPGARWSLPLYELALLTARHLFERRVAGVELEIVTHEPAPLALFGDRASRWLAELLEQRGIALRTGTRPAGVEWRSLLLEDGGRITADRVVTLPELAGRRVEGLPADERGFVAVDAHGRVRGLERVYAAGDLTTYPVKQGGLAALQADAAAEAIAAAAGVPLRPAPFRPVLRALLMTGDGPAYLRADIAHGAPERSVARRSPLWWPAGKIAGRYLAPYLAARAGVGLPHDRRAGHGPPAVAPLEAAAP